MDASAAVELILRPEPHADVLAGLVGETVRVPAHFDAEVLSGIMRERRRGRIDASRAELALLEVVRLAAERVPLPGMLAEAYALRDRFTANDALYVVVARRSSAPLLTADAPLARAAAGYVEVRTIPTA